MRVKLPEPQTGVVSQASQFMQQVTIKNYSDLPLKILQTITSKGIRPIVAQIEAKLLFTKKEAKACDLFCRAAIVEGQRGQMLDVNNCFLILSATLPCRPTIEGRRGQMRGGSIEEVRRAKECGLG